MSEELFQHLQAIFLKLFPERIDLLCPFERLLEDVVLEDTCPLDTIWEDHDTDSVLDSLIPNPHIHAFIGPAHHTVPVPLIVEIVALILVTGLPVEDAETVFFVVFIHTFVRVALSLAIFVSLLLLPFPVAVFETVDELAGVATSILPFVLSETFGLSIAVLANVAVTVREEVRPVALTETL